MVEDASLRLLPSLMTTGAMVSSAIPLALASGAGAVSRQAIGGVIVGGMSVGTVLTLIVVPTAYTLPARARGRAAVRGARSGGMSLGPTGVNRSRAS